MQISIKLLKKNPVRNFYVHSVVCLEKMISTIKCDGLFLLLVSVF